MRTSCEMPDFGDNSKPCGQYADDFLMIDFLDEKNQSQKYRVRFCDSHYYAILRLGEVGMQRLWMENKLHGEFIDG